MRNPAILSAIALAFTLAASQASAVEIYVENTEGLKPLPPAVLLAISERAAGFDDKPCPLIGKRISLSKSPAPDDYYVTTANGCGWGSAAGPFWLIRKNGPAYVEVLADGGTLLRIDERETKGLKNVVVVSENAGTFLENRQYFDGRRYQDKKPKATAVRK
jgi:hypothetical protein